MRARLAQSTLGFALAIPFCLALALALPLVQGRSLMDFVALLGSGLALALPFVLAGVALTLALTRAGLPASRAYGIDLIGAARGCALVIPVLALLDAPSAALLAAALAAAAALFGACRPARGCALARDGRVGSACARAMPAPASRRCVPRG